MAKIIVKVGREDVQSDNTCKGKHFFYKEIGNKNRENLLTAIKFTETWPFEFHSFSHRKIIDLESVILCYSIDGEQL